MTLEQNKSVVRAWMDGWNARGSAAADDIFAETIVDHQIGTPDPVTVTRDEFKAGLDALVEKLGHGRFDQEDLFAEDDRVLVRWVAHGELRQPWLGLAATGQALALRGLNIFRVRDGRIVERWSFIDLADVLRQVGTSGATAS